MILYASQRGRWKELADHLLNGDQNDHVTVHEVSGFVSLDLKGALKEAYAISLATKCRQHLFSLSLNPPEQADVPVEDFEEAINTIEDKLDLKGQPRAIVFHEKLGRRHCHVVWSRIKADTLTAVNMSHFKHKLMRVSKGLFLKHGWDLPAGFKKQQADPLNLSRQEYRQSLRVAQDSKALKRVFNEAWEQSDSKATFAHALEEHGFLLARGDRRGFVAVDLQGKVYALSRWMTATTRQLKERLGKPSDLPTIDQAKAFMAERMTDNLRRYQEAITKRHAARRAPLVQELKTLVRQQRKERKILLKHQSQREVAEARARLARYARGGIAGLWEQASGKRKERQKQDILAIEEAIKRDRAEMHRLIRKHLVERRQLEQTLRFYKQAEIRDQLRLQRELAQYISTGTEPKPPEPKQADSLTEKIEQLEQKIILLGDDVASLQASLENAMLSDDLRAKIRQMIDRALEAMRVKQAQDYVAHQKAEQAQKEEKQAQLQACIRQYERYRQLQEEEHKKQEANRSLYALIDHMGYHLNGIPRWQISVMSPPPDKRLNEQKYSQSLRQQSNATLLETLFNSSKPVIDPPMATVNLRMSILDTKEALRRAGLRPDDNKRTLTKAPKQNRQQRITPQETSRFI